MNQSFQQQQLWNTYRNGGGQVLDSGGNMMIDGMLRAPIPGN